MLLADFGADVVRIDRPGRLNVDILCRRKRSIQLDLKIPSSKAVLEKLLLTADVLIDPFRPEVLEGLGLAPIRLMRRNERLIVARLTGFRRDGQIKNFKSRLTLQASLKTWRVNFVPCASDLTVKDMILIIWRYRVHQPISKPFFLNKNLGVLSVLLQPSFTV